MSAFCNQVELGIRAKVPDVWFEALYLGHWRPLNNGETFYSSGSNNNWNENVGVNVRSNRGHDLYIEAQNPVMNYPWIGVKDNKTGRSEWFRFSAGENKHFPIVVADLHFYGFRTADRDPFKVMNVFIELPR